MFSKGISGAGPCAVRYSEFGHPGFCAVLEGRCRLAVEGEEPVILAEGDFVLLPATPAFTLSSLEPAIPKRLDPVMAQAQEGEVAAGDALRLALQRLPRAHLRLRPAVSPPGARGPRRGGEAADLCLG